MQLVCKHWYSVVIPQAMHSVDIRAQYINKRLEEMLSSEPENLKDINKLVWKKMQPLTPAFLFKFWQLVETEARMTDATEAEFDKWE